MRDRSLFCKDASGESWRVDSFDWIWLIGFGSRHTFLDRMQLLNSVPQHKFVNTVHACLYLHNKAAFLSTPVGEFLPRSIVSDDVGTLCATIQQGGRWVVKPTAGSFGRDVLGVTRDSPDFVRVIERLAEQGYVLLQERISTENEKRWFFAMGSVLGVYAKIKPGLRGNLVAHSQPQLCSPTEQEQVFANQVAKLIAEQGILACAVDIAYPFVLDVNFINPGWFQSMQSLTGMDYSQDLPKHFDDYRRTR